jgi:nicotinate-nucleotide adenylyltransferase
LNSRERKENRIALFGGTFDPIHNGHLALAEAALSQLGVDEVVFIPTQLRYYKTTKLSTTAYDRASMVALALEPYDRMRISDMELCCPPEENYTVNTLRKLKQEDPDRELIFLIGGDSLEHLGTWREPAELFRLATFAAAVRDDVDPARALDLIRGYEREYPGAKLELLTMEPKNISSTVIRERAAKGESLEGLVPAAVERYIVKQRLYLQDRV